jgi:hypothetical protein
VPYMTKKKRERLSWVKSKEVDTLGHTIDNYHRIARYLRLQEYRRANNE